jgi:hypothetical protein
VAHHSAQFASLIVALLATAALIAWVTGDTVEALAIVVVSINQRADRFWNRVASRTRT